MRSSCAVRSTMIFCKCLWIAGQCLGSTGKLKCNRKGTSSPKRKMQQLVNVYAASTALRRYRLRRLAWLRSMPLNSAPNSCAVISRRTSPASENGIA